MTGLGSMLATLADSVLSVVGIRGAYEMPPYTIARTLAPQIELRQYGARMAVEAVLPRKDAGQAFGLLFRYISGANAGRSDIAMTAPVELGRAPESVKIPMTVPVQTQRADGTSTMRFFLPDSVARHGAPAPVDPRLHIVQVPAATLGVVRFSGFVTETARRAETARLLAALRGAGLTAGGDPFLLLYDPPFTVPFLRRNEVAVPIA